MSLGLRDYKSPYKLFCRARFRDYFYELKYAFQRFWKGYDDTYFISLNWKLDQLIPAVLTRLRYDRHGSPVINDENTCHEDWDKILDEILIHFKEANEDTCSEKNEFANMMNFLDFEFKDIGNGLSEYIDNNHPDVRKKWYDRAMEIDKFQSEHRKQAYMMIAEYIECFWD